MEFDIALLSSRDDHSSPLRKAMGHEKHSLSYTAPIRANRGSYGSTEHNHEGRELDYEEKKRKKKKKEEKKRIENLKNLKNFSFYTCNLSRDICTISTRVFLSSWLKDLKAMVAMMMVATMTTRQKGPTATGTDVRLLTAVSYNYYRYHCYRSSSFCSFCRW